MTVFIRFALTAALIYGAYTETGAFTAVCFALIFAGFEALTYVLWGNK